MSGDIRHFRRRLFGGFDTSDVMHYIEELAGQRNKYKKTGDKLEQELSALNAEIKRLQSDLSDADQRITDIKVKTLDDASVSISTLRDSYTSIQTEVETTTVALSSELSKLNETLSYITSVLDQTGSRFAELSSLLEQEKSDTVTAHKARLKDEYVSSDCQ